MAKINGREYDFADITVVVGGRDILGIRGVEYSIKGEKEALYAKGRKPYSIQRGVISCEGSITVVQRELEALLDASSGSILDIVVDIEIHYGGYGSATRTDRIVGAEFTEFKKGMKQGDKHMDIDLPFIAMDFQNNV